MSDFLKQVGQDINETRREEMEERERILNEIGILLDSAEGILREKNKWTTAIENKFSIFRRYQVGGESYKDIAEDLSESVDRVKALKNDVMPILRKLSNQTTDFEISEELSDFIRKSRHKVIRAPQENIEETLEETINSAIINLFDGMHFVYTDKDVDLVTQKVNERLANIKRVRELSDFARLLARQYVVDLDREPGRRERMGLRALEKATKAREKEEKDRQDKENFDLAKNELLGIISEETILALESNSLKPKMLRVLFESYFEGKSAKDFTKEFGEVSPETITKWRHRAKKLVMKKASPNLQSILSISPQNFR